MRRFAGFLGAFAFLACASLANATMTINYEINGGGVVTCGTGSDAGPVTCASFSGGGVTVASVQSTSNSPGASAGAQQFGSTVQITSTADATVTIWMTAQDFNEPTFKPTVYQNGLTLNGTFLNTGSETVTLQTCVDNTNGTAPAMGCSGGSLSQTLSDTGAATVSNTIFGSATQGALYSLQQELTLTLHAGDNFNITSSQSLSVPEPASIVLLGIGLIGITTLLRKKAARQS